MPLDQGVQRGQKVSREIAGEKHLKQVLKKHADAYKDDVAREVKEYGEVRPLAAQVGIKTWKSYSKVRYPSKDYRDGYDRINWTV